MKPSSTFVAILLCATACGSSSKKSGAGSGSPSGSAAANTRADNTAATRLTSLDGTWHVVAISDDQGKLQATAGPHKTTLSFAAGAVSGSAGCNNINGTVTQTDAAVTWRNVVITELACPDKAMMQQEGAYWHAVNASATFKIVDGTVEFRNQAGAVTLTATKAP